MRSYDLFLAGAWRQGDTEEEIRSPYDGRVVGKVAFADRALLEEALARGKEAAPAMARLAGHARRALLRRIAEGIEAEAEAFAEHIRDEAGKPITLARGEVARAVQTFELAAEEAWRLGERSVPLDAVPAGEGRFGIVRRFPVGLVVAITPFNFPLNLVAHKLAPAFAAGCPVVLKPAERTPMTALLLAQICEEAGVPAGGLSVLPAHREVSSILAEDPRPRLLTFTGSPKVGWMLRGMAGQKRVALELGGNAAVLVCADTEVEAAAKRCAFGAYAYAGQVCISVQRIFVERAIYGRFLEAFRAYVEGELGVGDPKDPRVLSGPLIDEANVERVLAWIDEAKARGATLLFGGEREGNVLRPALLEGVPKDARLVCEEVFGPIATIEPFDDFEEALARADDSAFGLQAGVFTEKASRIWQAFERLWVGAVIHNDVPTFRVDQMPYGGVKASGLGREGLPYAFDDYTERRLLALWPGGPS